MEDVKDINMEIDEMITFISDRKTLTIDGWNDGHGSVRVGINWNLETGKCEFLIERTNLKLALTDVVEVITYGVDKWRDLDNKRKKQFHSDVKTYLHLIEKGDKKDEAMIQVIEGWIRERKSIPQCRKDIIEYLETYCIKENGYEEAKVY